MMISNEKAGKVRKEGNITCAICRKGVDSNFTLYQFCKCWVHKWCSGISGRLKQDDEFKCQIWAIQEIDTTTEESSGI